MIAQELHQSPFESDGPAPPAGSPPHQRSPLLGVAAVAAAIIVGGVAGGAATSILNNHAQPTAAASTSTTSSGSTASTTSSTASNGSTLSAEAIYQQDAPSVVTITTDVVGRFGQQGEGTGSGVVLDTQGNILTNAHVIAGAQQVTVAFADGRSVAATVVSSDRASDLAVIHVSVAASSLHPIPIGNSDALQVGDAVYAIGSPFGLSGTMTEGVVSALHRSNPDAQTSNSDLIQTDAAINPGNSGGALINAEGQLVGINESITSPVNGNVGIGFAIPINQIEHQLPTLEQGQ